MTTTLIALSVLQRLWLAILPAPDDFKYRATFVTGVAVYRDTESDLERRAGGVLLHLGNARIDGTIHKLPDLLLDRDLTATKSEFGSLAEGIFQLQSPNLRDKVCVIYRLPREEGPIKEEPPRFFSQTFYPKQQVNRERVVVKTWFLLWPTDRPVKDERALASLMREIVRTRYGWNWKQQDDVIPRLPEDEARPNILYEFKILANLLPRDQGQRTAMIDRAIAIFREWLAEDPRIQTSAAEWLEAATGILKDPDGSYLEREQNHWRSIRERAQ
ncbi:MAG: hypothetical protein U0800_17300 [Isosphaeraceae bacterium]